MNTENKSSPKVLTKFNVVYEDAVTGEQKVTFIVASAIYPHDDGSVMFYRGRDEYAGSFSKVISIHVDSLMPAPPMFSAFARADTNEPIKPIGNFDTLDKAKAAVRKSLADWTSKPRCLFKWQKDLHYTCGDIYAGYVIDRRDSDDPVDWVD